MLDRHPRLLKCVKHIWEENKSGVRALSLLKLSPGECAAMMYMWAAQTSDYNRYKNAEPPRESMLEFSAWDKAEEFFALIGKDASLKPVQAALAALANDDTGLTTPKKHGILTKAWGLFSTGKKVTEASLRVGTYTDAQGRLLVEEGDRAKFGNLDQGDGKNGGGDDDPEETEKEKEAVRQRQAEEASRKVADSNRAAKAAVTPPAPTPIPVTKALVKNLNSGGPPKSKPAAAKLKLPPANRREQEAKQTADAMRADLEAAILKCLDDPTSVGDMEALTGAPRAELVTVLAEMEAAGKVRGVPGGMWERV
jgi:hypothetical protein